MRSPLGEPAWVTRPVFEDLRRVPRRTIAWLSLLALVGAILVVQRNHGFLGIAASIRPHVWVAAPLRNSLRDSVRVPILVYHSIAPHHPGQSAEQREARR